MAKAITFYQMVMGQAATGRPVSAKHSPIGKGIVGENKVDNNNRFEVVDVKNETGEIIMQEKVPVMEGDTPEDLAARVLKVEHVILAEGLKKAIERLEQEDDK